MCGASRTPAVGSREGLDPTYGWSDTINTPYRTATGVTVEPEAPCIFIGCIRKANS